MDRKKFSSVMDEAINQLEKEVRVLKTQQANLAVNVKNLEGVRDKLSKEIYDLGVKRDLVIKETEDKKNSIIKTAQEKLDKATAKDTEASNKLSEFNQKQKEAEDIIKSNKGLKDNLSRQQIDLDNKIKKIDALIKLSQETLKNL